MNHDSRPIQVRADLDFQLDERIPKAFDICRARVGHNVDILRRAHVAMKNDGETADDDELDILLAELAEEFEESWRISWAGVARC